MFKLFRRKQKTEKTLSTVPSSGWKILEFAPGDWQRGITYSRESVTAFPAIFSCLTLIASDIAKLKPRLIRTVNGVKTALPIHGFDVLRKPNAIMTCGQFYETWLLSKLLRGNAYILLERDLRGNVIRLHPLNPDLVMPLVSETGDVFYQLQPDNISGLTKQIVAPASEIIHDRFNCLYHPLVGLSPITACGLAAFAGVKNLENAAAFFKNQSRPSGILVAPGTISDETAVRLKADWETNFGGDKLGKIAVLGDDLKYVPLSITPDEAKAVEQLKISIEAVCSCFHVPLHKVTGNAPTYDNTEKLELAYYAQCLQPLIEAIEACLDEALGVPANHGVEFDLENLLRMDSATQIKTLSEAVRGGLMTPNEARVRLGMPALEGGNSVYLQQQYYSLEALARRDAKEDPFGTRND